MDKNKYYNLSLSDRTYLPIEVRFNTLVEIDDSQHHRVMLNSIELSRLKSLDFVGDKYEFNNITVILKDINKYLIVCREYDFQISFGLGDYDAVILYSYLKFNIKIEDRLNKIASCMAVKDLLRKQSGNLTPDVEIPQYFDFNVYYDLLDILDEKSREYLKKMYVKDTKKDIYYLTKDGNENKIYIYDILNKIDYFEKGIKNDTEKIKNYDKFIDQLKRMEKDEIFNYLLKYIELNFILLMDTGINSDWINPQDLYYYKSGNYKSIAFFCYFVLKTLNFDVKFYMVTDLIRKDKDNINKLLRADKNEKQAMEREYRYVKNSYNVNELLNYNPPDLNKSKFIVTLENNKKWIYSYGSGWVDHNIHNSDRCTSDYMGRGCYFSLFESDMIILHNEPIDEKDIEWDVFYDIK